MGISRHPSTVTLPHGEHAYPSILEFLVARFPTISQARWEQRIAAGKVRDRNGRPITTDTAYVPLTRILYYREVEEERVIPFQEEILFHNDHILVACKPHFLPVTPGGAYVDECLLNRLRKRTGIEYLAPIHRIDRGTAGIVMFSVNRRSSDLYHALFRNAKVEKTYQALAACGLDPEAREWVVENRIVTGEPWFRMRTATGEANACSRIKLAEVRGRLARFVLSPLTGRTHQLRLHMSGLGFGILNDRLYPVLQPEKADDFNMPLQLIAKKLEFRDPVTGRDMAFVSERRLMWQ
jgi:tRNA pseudouridine32 synthase / 23S rRNA pseudouridine746 synthase